jgi:hypothetical protein
MKSNPPDRENRKVEKGSAFIMAIFAMALVAIIGLVLVMNIQTERAISRNQAATSKAFFLADTGLNKLRAFLDYDFAYDRIGLAPGRGWANRWLLVPNGTTGALQTNSAGVGPGGEAVGLPNVTFFDLGNDPNQQPYYINTTISGATGQINQNSWRVMFRNFKESPGSANPFSDRRLFILVAGRSENYGTGLQVVNAGRFVELGIAAEPISIWDNVAFLGDPPSDPDVLGNIKLHGSLHIIDGTAGQTTVHLGGNIGFENYYPTATQPTACCGNTSPDTMLTDRMAPLPVNVRGEVTMNSKIRIRKGNLTITGSGTIGCANNPNNSVKESFDALYINGSFPSSQMYFDKIDTYDVPDEFLNRLVFPDPISNNQPYFHRETNTNFPNYQAFLVGNPDGNLLSPDFGAAALDLTAINYNLSNNQNERWEFSQEPNCNPANNSCESRHLLTQILTLPGGSENRGLAGNNDTYINGRSGSWLLRNLAGGNNPPGNPSLPGSLPFQEGTRIYFGFDRTDGQPVIGFKGQTDTSITYVEGGALSNTQKQDNHNGAYFVLKHIQYGNYMVVSGLVYFPRGASISQKFTNFLFYPGGTNWNTMFPLATGHKGILRLMNDFLTVTPQSAGIDGDPDFDPQDWGLPAVPPSPPGYAALGVTTYSSIMASGIILLPGPVYFTGATSGTPSDRRLEYDGRFTFYVPSWGDCSIANVSPSCSATSDSIHIDTHLLPKVQFPCNDAIALMSVSNVESGGGVSQKRGALVLYVKNTHELGHQMDLGGSMVAADLTMSGTGNPNYLQSPALNGCLPDFLIAKDPITYIRPMNWVER